MEAEHLDAFLVSHLPNIFYLTGFSGSNAALLISFSQAILFTDTRYRFQAKCETPDAQIRIVNGSAMEGAAVTLRSGRALRVGFESSRVTVAQKDAFAHACRKAVHWLAWDGRIEAERMMKDPGELATMRQASAIACSAWKAALPLTKPGVLECELAAEIEYRMHQMGADGCSFETIVASGKRSAWPHARASRKPIEKNELVVFDLGAILRGYSSDLTRTVHVGRASARVRGWYKAVLEAQKAAQEAAQPGVNAENIDSAARGVIRRAGFGREFIHSTGHGLGLEVHEMPRLGRGEKTLIRENMVVTIEPGVYFEGQGGIRIEDDVRINRSGAEFITNASRELIEIG